jgi:hypothetical protein
MSLKLLSTGNPKILKGIKSGYNTYILHLAPATLSGHNTCPKATHGCAAACLNTAGRGGMFKKGESTNTIQMARIRKTQLFFNNRNLFMDQLVKDIELAIKQSKRLGLIPVFRLNGTSDLSWEKYSVVRDGVVYTNIFEAFSDYQFYDYTKVLGRKVKHIGNYHLTFSMADGNYLDCKQAVIEGMNIAVVFGIKKGTEMPRKFFNHNMTVFNGDDSDLRFLDPKNSIIGLYAKGKAKKDTSGFVKYPVGDYSFTMKIEAVA